MPRSLTTTSATALYVGAVLGPGVLLVPALVAAAAGPASVLAWVALLLLSLPLVVTFAALGVRQPEAGGSAAYARKAFGPLAGRVTGWWFLTGVLVGAPAVAYIGGLYVAELAGAGRGAAVAAAAAMVAVVVLANARGLSTTARMQLALSALLALLLAVAVVFALPAGRAEQWTPFAPHGWTAVGSAASLLMFSFIGWEAVSHLAGELPDPARQLPRAAFGALAVVAVLYLGLALATVGVLGADEPSHVPLADLMGAGLGAPGRAATLFVAVLLTVGTMSTYVAAAVNLAGALVGPRMPRGRALAIFSGATALLLVALATGAAGVEGLIRASSAAFVAVYLPATGAGVRLLRGRARAAALVAVSAITVVLAFAGPFLLVPAVVAVAIAAAAAPRRLASSRSVRRGPRARRDAEPASCA